MLKIVSPTMSIDKVSDNVTNQINFAVFRFCLCVYTSIRLAICHNAIVLKILRKNALIKFLHMEYNVNQFQIQIIYNTSGLSFFCFFCFDQQHFGHMNDAICI